MRLLLDTHVLVWLAEGLDDLPPKSRRLIDEAASSTGLAVSAISFWEIAMLESRGRIALSSPISDWRKIVITTNGMQEIPVSGDITIESVRLPGEFHSDPADRLIAATARIHGLRLGTRDSRLLAYGESGHLSTLRL